MGEAVFVENEDDERRGGRSKGISISGQSKTLASTSFFPPSHKCNRAALAQATTGAFLLEIDFLHANHRDGHARFWEALRHGETCR